MSRTLLEALRLRLEQARTGPAAAVAGPEPVHLVPPAVNVISRLEDLRWVERDQAQRIHLGKPADLLEAWRESYTYRANENYVVVTRNGVQRKAPPNAPIQPDDVIKVPERYF